MQPIKTFRIYGYVSIALMLAGTSTAAAQIFKLPHADTTAGNFFGVSVAIDGERALVGASGENACGTDSGAAYIFERNPETNTWHEAARLTASNCQERHFFGRSLALSGDRAVVAAAGEFFSQAAPNAAYVFERDTSGTWHEVGRLLPEPRVTEGVFATSVSLDGDRILVTTSGDPSGTNYHGAVYIYERSVEGFWRKQVRLTSNASLKRGVFGGSGDLDGDRLVVAASTYFEYNPGSVYLYERNPQSGDWEETTRIGEIDDFFISVDLEGDRLLIGESKDGRRQTGAATLYERQPNDQWKRITKIRSRTPYELGAFGSVVSFGDGFALATGYDEQLRMDFNIDRVVYVFREDPETDDWKQQQVVDIGEVAFGSAIAHDGPYAIIGHASEAEPGAAYIVQIR